MNECFGSTKFKLHNFQIYFLLKFLQINFLILHKLYSVYKYNIMCVCVFLHISFNIIE